MRTVSVVTADDHPVYRAGIRRAIELDARIELLGEAADGTAALELLIGARPQVALLDHDMPGLTGTAVAAELLRRGAGVAVVILTAAPDDAREVLARAPGVVAVLSKSLSRRAICDVVVATGEGAMEAEGAVDA